MHGYGKKASPATAFDQQDAVRIPYPSADFRLVHFATNGRMEKPVARGGVEPVRFISSTERESALQSAQLETAHPARRVLAAAKTLLDNALAL